VKREIPLMPGVMKMMDTWQTVRDAQWNAFVQTLSTPAAPGLSKRESYERRLQKRLRKPQKK